MGGSTTLPPLLLLVACAAAAACAGCRGAGSAAVDRGTAAASGTSAHEELIRAKRDTAARMHRTTERRMFSADVIDFDGIERLYQWSRRWMDAELALAGEADAGAGAAGDKGAAVRAHLARMTGLRDTVRRRSEGAGEPFARAADYYVAEAELWLAELDRP